MTLDRDAIMAAVIAGPDAAMTLGSRLRVLAQYNAVKSGAALTLSNFKKFLSQHTSWP